MTTKDEAQATPDPGPTTVGIHMSVFAPTISEQLVSQGLTADPEDVAAWQKDREAWNRLRIRGILTDGESSKVAKRMIKNIAAKVVPE